MNMSKEYTETRDLFQIFPLLVPELTVSVFCLKFVRYCMYLWLPMYLMEHLGYSAVQGGAFSAAYDVGGVIGGPLLGETNS